MIVWGGSIDLGGRYRPSTNTWSSLSSTGAPWGRAGSAAVWTGTEMLVFGGTQGSTSASLRGGRYDPATDSWSSMSSTGAPSARLRPYAVWTGTEMIVWGGVDRDGLGGDDGRTLSDGGRYDPATDTWRAISSVDAPGARDWTTVVWTGSEMILWGGDIAPDADTRVATDTAAAYAPSTDTWRRLTTVDAPRARIAHSATWSGTEMIVWGGTVPGGSALYTGDRYRP